MVLGHRRPGSALLRCHRHHPDEAPGVRGRCEAGRGGGRHDDWVRGACRGFAHPESRVHDRRPRGLRRGRGGLARAAGRRQAARWIPDRDRLDGRDRPRRVRRVQCLLVPAHRSTARGVGPARRECAPGARRRRSRPGEPGAAQSRPPHAQDLGEQDDRGELGPVVWTRLRHGDRAVPRHHDLRGERDELGARGEDHSRRRSAGIIAPTIPIAARQGRGGRRRVDVPVPHLARRGTLVLSRAAALLGGLAPPEATAEQVALELPTVAAATIGVFLTYFLGGFLLYSAMFAVVGAISSNEQEARQAQLPVMILLMIAYLSVFALATNPGSAYAVALSPIPFTAPIAMPVRWAAGSLPGYEIGLSLGILAAAIVGVTWTAARIYRIGILMTGKRPSVKELARWVRA